MLPDNERGRPAGDGLKVLGDDQGDLRVSLAPVADNGHRTRRNLAWPPILDQAAAIVRSYDTLVTLRQLFYRLVAAQVLANTTAAYKTLSARSAEARREGWFPDLIDRDRTIHEFESFRDPAHALDDLASWFRLDRTIGQDVSVYLAVEKRGLVEQLTAWFGHLGYPVLALGGYTSQSFIREVQQHVARQGRPAVLLYAGDHDPSGEDIDRDFIARTDCFTTVVRVALSAEQVQQYGLPPQAGKASDSRAAAFVARHGDFVQVEVDALPPETLRALFTEAITPFQDVSAYEQVMEREATYAVELQDLASGWGSP